MKQRTQRLGAYLTGISAAIALIISLGLPAGYWTIIYRSVDIELASEADLNAEQITKIVHQYPDTWNLQLLRLEALIAEDYTLDVLPEYRAIYDERGQLIAASEATKHGNWWISHQAPFYDAGRIVGTVEISGNLEPLVVETMLVALLGLLIGGGVFVTLRVLPMRALKEAINELQAEKEKAEITLASIGDGVITVDAHGRITYLNEAALGITGWQADAARGRRLREVMPFDPAPGNDEAAIAASPMATVVFPGADGEARAIEYTFSPMRADDGASAGGVAVLRDVTERRQAETWLNEINQDLEARVEERTRELAEAKQVAEAASQAKSAFVANMSHEIRTPMNSVLGMAHLALRSGLPPKQQAYIENILTSGHHLLRLINDILDISKIEAGRLQLENVDFELAEVIDSVINVSGEKAAAKGLALHLEIDPGVAGALRGDPLRLGQVLINLVGNAVKFTEQGGITLRAARADGADGESRIRFEVADSGIGMSPEETARIFKAFQQADTSTTRRFGGSGLGLAISKQLVTLMGGEIGVESVAGQGSTFWFTARFAPGQKRAAAPAMATLSAGEFPAVLKGARFLLAEDNPFNQQVACEMLEDAGAVVHVTNNGKEALDLLTQEHFDCVLMDVQMPEMDGFTATRQIRGNPDLAKLIVIAMTANATSEDRARCLAAGMDDFITKPVMPERLYAVLARWLSGQPGEPATPGTMPAPEAPRGEPQLIDLAVLGRMVNNNPDKVRKYAEKFVAATRDALAGLDAALAAGDMVRVAEAGHKIKSSARGVGALHFGDLCQQLEALRRADDAAPARAIVAQLHTQLAGIAEKVSSELRAPV